MLVDSSPAGVSALLCHALALATTEQFISIYPECLGTWMYLRAENATVLVVSPITG